MGTGRFGSAGIELWNRPRDRIQHRHAVVETGPAYIICTSGTTGRLKGVVMTQRGIVSYFRMLMADSNITPAERVATTAPLQFDLSLFDVGIALGSLASCVAVPRTLLRRPRRFPAAPDGHQAPQSTASLRSGGRRCDTNRPTSEPHRPAPDPFSGEEFRFTNCVGCVNYGPAYGC
ncbi:AMP-binding protein [Streptomyces sp. NPDC055709]